MVYHGYLAVHREVTMNDDNLRDEYWVVVHEKRGRIKLNNYFLERAE